MPRRGAGRSHAHEDHVAKTEQDVFKLRHIKTRLFVQKKILVSKKKIKEITNNFCSCCHGGHGSMYIFTKQKLKKESEKDRVVKNYEVFRCRFVVLNEPLLCMGGA
jgi:hypothetical protein